MNLTERAREIVREEFAKARVEEFGLTDDDALHIAREAALRLCAEREEWLGALVCPDCGSDSAKTETAGVPHCPDCGRIQVRGTRIHRLDYLRRKEVERG